MTSIGQVRATLDDLLREPRKAELLHGRIVALLAAGFLPNRIAGRIFRKLAEYAERRGRGEALTDNMGFAVPELPSGRESFSPDVAYYDGPLPVNLMRFLEGPPTLAVEVRSEGDYGSAAELTLADKRADYFAAGTTVMWDVDPLAESIAVYRSSAPDQPTVFVRGQIADAEPAVPGWRLAVEDLFGPAMQPPGTP